MSVINLPEGHQERVASVSEKLMRQFNARFELQDPGQLDLAHKLTSQIGDIDWEIEGYRSAEAQRDLSIKFHWGHDHRFNADFSVAGRMGDRHIKLLAEFFEGFGLTEQHFNGKSVLDVGCWTGGTTLSMKMLGAHRVQALEEVRKYAATTQSLCRDVYGFDDVTCSAISLFEFEQDTFDCVYVPGVVYHLSDPVLGLRRLYNRLNEGGDILVESAGIDDPNPICRFDRNTANAQGDSETLNRGGWNWFMPSAACLKAWMETAGFEQVRSFRSPTGRIFGYGKRIGFRDITRAGLSVPTVE